MPSYTAPTKDMQFILHEVLKVTQADVPGYEELEPEFTNAILEEAGIPPGVFNVVQGAAPPVLGRQVGVPQAK